MYPKWKSEQDKIILPVVDKSTNVKLSMEIADRIFSCPPETIISNDELFDMVFGVVNKHVLSSGNDAESVSRMLVDSIFCSYCGSRSLKMAVSRDQYRREHNPSWLPSSLAMVGINDDWTMPVCSYEYLSIVCFVCEGMVGKSPTDFSELNRYSIEASPLKDFVNKFNYTEYDVECGGRMLYVEADKIIKIANSRFNKFVNTTVSPMTTSQLIDRLVARHNNLRPYWNIPISSTITVGGSGGSSEQGGNSSS